MTTVIAQPVAEKALAAANPSGDRDAVGRFVNGCSGGPGRFTDAARMMQAFRHAALACTSPEDVARVMEVLRDKALAGDVRAITEYLNRMLGKAEQSLVIATGEASPAEARIRLVALLAAHPAIMAALPVIDADATPVESEGVGPPNGD